MAFDYTLFFACSFIVTILYFTQKRWFSSKPYLETSSTLHLKKANSWWPTLPSVFLWIALGLFIIAFGNPTFYKQKKIEPKTEKTEGIAIYLVLDQSGSMAEEIITYTSKGKRKKKTKLQLTKEVTEKFILGDEEQKGKPNDLIGLISFARGANILSPLTLDHSSITKRLQGVSPVSQAEQDGTAIGYAIYKTVNLIEATKQYSQTLPKQERPAYEIRNSIIILVTDGLQDPNPLDIGDKTRTISLEEAAKYARKNGIKLYLINIEPKILSERFAPNRRQLQRITKLTGGEFYMVQNPQDLASIYHDINLIEKSTLERPSHLSKAQQPDLYEEILFYPILVSTGMVLLAIAILLKTLFIRQNP